MTSHYTQAGAQQRKGGGGWNYRVIEFVDPYGDPWRAIHEVYYDAEGSPNGYTEEPAVILADENDNDMQSSMAHTLDRMREALALPVLVETDFRR